MDYPTIDDLRTWSRLPWADYDADSDDRLGLILAAGIVYVEQTTGRVPLTDTPDNLVPLAQAAVRMKSEQQAVQDGTEYVEGMVDDLVQSFTAGSYSETRRNEETRLSRGGSIAGLPIVNSWPQLNEILFLLMTDDKRIYWHEVLGGIYAPAMAVTEVDWSGAYYGVSEQGGWPGRYFPGGW